MNQAQRDKLLIELNVGINGNGTKGLHGRIEDIEEWKEKRPQECPAKPPSRSTIIAQRALEVAVIGLVLAIGRAIAKTLGWW